MRRRDVAYDGDPVDSTKVPSATAPEDKITENTGAILDAVARLRPRPGYVNGHDYED